MSAIIEAKKQHIDEIAEQLKNSVSTVIVDYRGLTVEEVTELRSQLREAGVEYKVYKTQWYVAQLKKQESKALKNS